MVFIVTQPLNKVKTSINSQVLYTCSLNLDMVFGSTGICLQYKHMKSLIPDIYCFMLQHLKHMVRWQIEGRGWETKNFLLFFSFIFC